MRSNVVGERVKRARFLSNPKITQLELATRLQLDNWNIDRGGIAKIETGIRKVTDYEVLKLAKALGVYASWLLGETDDNSR